MISLPLVALALLPYALAAPQSEGYADPLHVPLTRRNRATRVANLPKIADALRVKYGYKPKNLAKRASSASIPITDEENDSSYSGVVSIGTPPQNLNLVLDTGSSDLWMATTQCTTCTPDIITFDPSKSSSFKTSASNTQIQYGSGNAQGTVSQDTVSMGGFTVSAQTLLAVNSITGNLIDDGLSGIMGLGFQTISALEVAPFWVALNSANQLSSPVMSFYFERYVDQVNEIDAAPGGVFTLGGTNTSLYTGNIEFINMPSGSTPSYWYQAVDAVTVQGTSITIPSGSSLSAIDTGTTLIGAPTAIVANIWNAVPGSQALTGQYEGMYAFPCTTDVSITISFGGTAWSISSDDMNLGTISTGSSTGPMSGAVDATSDMCVGGIFDVGSSMGSGQGVPSWIVGDTFLKNVYTVFRADPPSVGFAKLAPGLSTTGSTGGSKGSGGGSGGGPFPGGAPSNTNAAFSLTVLVALAASLAIAL